MITIITKINGIPHNPETMDNATYLVATRLIEAMELDSGAKNESVKHSDWFNGLVDHLIEHEKAILA